MQKVLSKICNNKKDINETLLLSELMLKNKVIFFLIFTS